jgi:UDP-3-O-[3-hydroxymyristoyl] glucosamine N-acyltransferase
VVKNLTRMAVALSIGAFGIGLAPVSTFAFPASAPTVTTSADSNLQLAYVKKKVVVKKKAPVKKKVVVKKKAPVKKKVVVKKKTTVRPQTTIHMSVKTRPHCRMVVRTVKSHGRMVKVSRRVC